MWSVKSFHKIYIYIKIFKRVYTTVSVSAECGLVFLLLNFCLHCLQPAMKLEKAVLDG